VRTTVFVVILAATAGLLSFGVMGRGEQRRCFWAVTVGTNSMGYQEVPCDADARLPLGPTP